MKSDSLFYNISKKSKFFKRIYPYYNIYIRNIKFLFKGSQFNEDLKILKIFKKKGFYVDIGCYHPVRYNNTYRMFKLGWKGMNIDLNPLSIELFNVARPTELNICTAVSNKKVGNLYFDHELSPQNTLEKNHTVFYEKTFGHKIINIHPSLLPKYKGLNTHKRVIESKEKYSGCTVHFVAPKLDSGKIILQKKILIDKNETEYSLKTKILKQEYRLYSQSIISIFK